MFTRNVHIGELEFLLGFFLKCMIFMLLWNLMAGKIDHYEKKNFEYFGENDKLTGIKIF